MSVEFPLSGGSTFGPVESPFLRTQAPISPELGALPAPSHLHEYLTRSLHLHLGYFEGFSDSLAQAQDRLIHRSARFLARNSLVVDVGCGLGGTVNVLATMGHRVFGLDPCARSIAYARSRVVSPRAQFLVCTLSQFAGRARGARFDALYLTEALSNFPDLGALLSQCRAVLRPGGMMLVHDIVRHPEAPQGSDRFHARGALRSAADAACFDLIENREISNRTSPTLPRLARLLTERRDELLNVFGPMRPTVLNEIAQYQVRLRELEHGFAQEELYFEASVLRCSARMGNDSVVLRTQPRSEPTPLPLRTPPAPAT